MSAETGIGLISHIIDKKTDDMLFQRWINGNQHISFDSFKKALKKNQEMSTDDRTADEILQEVKSIMDGGDDL